MGRVIKRNQTDILVQHTPPVLAEAKQLFTCLPKKCLPSPPRASPPETPLEIIKGKGRCDYKKGIERLGKSI